MMDPRQLKRFGLAAVLLALLLQIGVTPLQAAPVKHVIVMISDGCGFNHIEASSLYRFGRPGGWLYQAFPVRLAASTFPDGGSYDPAVTWGDFAAVKKGATDSAASATALSSGLKTYNGAIGVGPDKLPVENVLERAAKCGKATGVVTTVPFSHATPAGFLAHNSGRGNYAEIAASMLDSRAEVIMGAGNPNYDDSGQPRGTPKYEYLSQELWAKLLAGGYGGDADGDGKPDPWTLIQRRAEFRRLLSRPVPRRVIGIAQAGSTLQEGRGGDNKAPAFAVPFSDNVPTLTEMTLGALRVLKQDPEGLCLMVEGGAVDWAAHSNLSGRLIEEEIDFSDAVEAVIAWVEKNSNWQETLLVVTADHETGYLTGPGSDPKWQPLVNNGKEQMPGTEWHSNNHTNSLVPLFARGAGSEYFLQHLHGKDPVRGPYSDNTEVARAVFAALGR